MKTIVVTGASSGIGAEIARLARFYGASVFGIDRNDPQITLDGFARVDLSDPVAIDEALWQLPEKIDGLVNAAGVSGTADAERVAKVNYLGLRHLTEALVERIAPGGSIVNLTSVLGAEWPARLDKHKQLAKTKGFTGGVSWLTENPVQQDVCYQYFKEALIVWTAKRGNELFLQRNIRMNCVSPGPVFTPILGEFIGMLGSERVERDSQLIKRPAFADEVAGPVIFLCSDAARWIVGANLGVDGGLAAGQL